MLGGSRRRWTPGLRGTRTPRPSAARLPHITLHRLGSLRCSCRCSWRARLLQRAQALVGARGERRAWMLGDELAVALARPVRIALCLEHVAGAEQRLADRRVVRGE